MAHHHDHSHSHSNSYGRAFAIGVTLNVAYVLIEAFAGFWLGSLALLADAGHNLSDVLGLVIAWIGHYLGSLPPTHRKTYGWRSSSILAALANALLLLVAVGGITWEAAQRFSSPVEVAGVPVMVVASIGVVINFVTALMFHSGRHHDVNIRGAYIHMAADAAVSLGVVIAGGLILWTGFDWIDPLISIMIAVVIFIGTWGLLRESVNLAMHGVPHSIDLDRVRECLTDQPGVTAVRDLHVWAMSTTEVALTAHVVVPEGPPDDEFFERAARELKAKFEIVHSTIQAERGEGSGCCPLGHG